MSKALDPLRRLVVQFNARFAQTQARALPTTNIPPSAPHLHHAPATTVHHHHTAATAAANKAAGLPFFGQFQVKVAIPSHKDGPFLLAHLNQRLNSLARNVFVPEPARVAAVNYACQSAGRPQMASLLSRGSQRMMHHQPLKFAIPHGFARNVGLSSTRGFCSSVSPAMNGPAKMLAQMYAKPLGILPTHAQKLSPSEKRDRKRASSAKRHSSKVHKSNKKAFGQVSTSTIRAFLARATLVEQQHQFLNLCEANLPVSTATAIALAKVAGKSAQDLILLPKLKSSPHCPTSVDMCFLLDASPLWHLDTMVSALHTDSLRAPKQLNGAFIEDLLEITNAQYQHFLEVSAILQRLVACPEAREITLEGYELRVHFEGTTLFEMTQFLKELAIDLQSPHFDLEEYYKDMELMSEQYFPQQSINNYYYAPSLSENETWDDCSSLHSSLMFYQDGDSERCSSMTSFATLEMPEPWEGAAGLAEEDFSISTVPVSVPEIEVEQPFEQVEAPVEGTVTSVGTSPVVAVDFVPAEDPAMVWTTPSPVTSVVVAEVAQEETQQSEMHESTRNLNALSSQILNSTVVSEEYFDHLRGFLDSLEAVHRQHSEKLYGSPLSSPAF
ncbi:hypothetical protein BGZ83_004908 [Gryganskiella cystojenkinii]|nr:hypothetical protein BGZ83_004908 [Gryganskiella cystojenkinii]